MARVDEYTCEVCGYHAGNKDELLGHFTHDHKFDLSEKPRLEYTETPE